MKFYGCDGLGSEKGSAEKVVYGKFTDKITTVCDWSWPSACALKHCHATRPYSNFN